MQRPTPILRLARACSRPVPAARAHFIAIPHGSDLSSRHFGGSASQLQAVSSRNGRGGPASSSSSRASGSGGRAARIDPADAKGSTNHSIPFRNVQLATPATPTQPGSLSDLQPLRTILSSLDTSTHTLICVSVSPPIVRILDNAAEKEKARHAEARLKITRKAAAEDKEVQVSWGSAEGDLRHKATMARGILERGDRATIIFAAKSGGAGISFSGPGAAGSEGGGGSSTKKDQKARVIQVFEDALGEIGVKWTDDEIRKGALVQRWQPEKKVRAEIRQKVQNEEVEKKRDKEEKKEARRKKEEERKRRAEEKQRESLEALRSE